LSNFVLGYALKGQFNAVLGANINQQDKYGRSPLHVCAAANHADMVEFLLQRGADIDSRSIGDEQTPLHFAAKNDATLSLKALLGFGANIDSLDNRGRTPLQVLNSW
jgi:ankyrin repeat protein